MSRASRTHTRDGLLESPLLSFFNCYRIEMTKLNYSTVAHFVTPNGTEDQETALDLVAVGLEILYD